MQRKKVCSCGLDYGHSRPCTPTKKERKYCKKCGLTYFGAGPCPDCSLLKKLRDR